MLMEPSDLDVFRGCDLPGEEGPGLHGRHPRFGSTCFHGAEECGFAWSIGDGKGARLLHGGHLVHPSESVHHEAGQLFSIMPRRIFWESATGQPEDGEQKQDEPAGMK